MRPDRDRPLMPIYPALQGHLGNYPHDAWQHPVSDPSDDG